VVNTYHEDHDGHQDALAAGVCTCVKKSAHYRQVRNGESRWFAGVLCGDTAVVEYYNPLTGERYLCCRAHNDDNATHAADRMGLIMRGYDNDED
jgi:hypothetical protein